MSLKSVWEQWQHFFFKSERTEGIAFFRIIWFSLLLMNFFFDSGNLEDFYGPKALVSLTTVRDQFSIFHLNILHMTGVDLTTLYFIRTIWGLALVLSIIGLYTRYSMLTVLICMVSFHQRNIWLLSSAEVLMRIITIYMVLSPAGHSLSIDALLGRKFAAFKKPREWAPWIMRLIQIQLCVVYLWTVWQKLRGSEWADGTALYYATRLEAFKNIPFSFILDSMFFIKAMTWGTLIIEIALGTLLWFKETRKPVLIAGILFHLGIEFMMSIPFFELIMIALLMSFIPTDVIIKYSEKFRNNLLMSIEDAKFNSSIKDKLIWILKD